MKQQTAEWFEARLGKVTASRVIDIIPNPKTGKYYATREKYMFELLAERISGVVQPVFLSKPMIHGTETEPIARAVYEGMTGNAVQEVGFIDHPTIKNFGASPDGLVGDDGCVEFKCPETTTHLKLMAREEIAPKYSYQMQTQMMCANREWCDFFNFDNRVPVEFQTFRRRVTRYAVACKLIESEVVKFLGELDALETKIRSHKA